MIWVTKEIKKHGDIVLYEYQNGNYEVVKQNKNIGMTLLSTDSYKDAEKFFNEKIRGMSKK